MTRETLIWLVAASLSVGFAVMVYAIMTGKAVGADCYGMSCLYGPQIELERQRREQQRQQWEIDQLKREMEMEKDYNRSKRKLDDLWKQEDRR